MLFRVGSMRVPGPWAGLRARVAALLSLIVVAGFIFLVPVSVVDAQSAAPNAQKKQKTLIDYVKDGGGIGHTIILCSIIGVSLSITYAFQIRRDVLVPPEVLGQLEQLFEEESYEEAFQVCEANPCFLSSVVAAGLSKLDEGYDAMQAAIAETGDAETTKMNIKISYISLIAAVAPMLGLFGTVSGMISTFDTIAGAEVQPKPSDLAGGISEALVTTYEGLVVAIPMIVLFNVFRNRITGVLLEISGIMEDLMGRFKTPTQAS